MGSAVSGGGDVSLEFSILDIWDFGRMVWFGSGVMDGVEWMEMREAYCARLSERLNALLQWGQM